MEKIMYHKLIEKVREKGDMEIDMTYEEYVSYFQILKEKINYNIDIYNNNQVLFELGEIATLIWGLFGFSVNNFLENDKEKIGIVFHSMATQISNSMLSILILCNQSLDMQSGIMIRSTCELCYTLLVVLINKEKRKKYIEAAQKQQENKIWNEEFRFKDLNKELQIFEAKITNNDKLVKKELSQFRRSIYTHYSEYTHNSFLTCLVNSYERNDDSSASMCYNIWGEKSSRVKKYLNAVADLNFFTLLDLFNYIIKNLEIKNYVGNDEEFQKLWNHAGYLTLIFREYYLESYSLINA